MQEMNMDMSKIVECIFETKKCLNIRKLIRRYIEQRSLIF